MWINLAWKPSARSSSSRALPTDGREKPLVGSSTDRDSASLSLMSMPLVRQPDSVPYPVLLNCLPLDAASMPSVRLGTQAASVVRWSAHAQPLFKCIHVNGSAPLRARAMATIAVSSPQHCEPLQPT